MTLWTRLVGKVRSSSQYLQMIQQFQVFFTKEDKDFIFGAKNFNLKILDFAEIHRERSVQDYFKKNVVSRLPLCYFFREEGSNKKKNLISFLKCNLEEKKTLQQNIVICFKEAKLYLILTLRLYFIVNPASIAVFSTFFPNSSQDLQLIPHTPSPSQVSCASSTIGASWTNGQNCARTVPSA